MVAETISGSSVGDPLLFIANREGDEAELIGEGHSPYWLNDHEVAFVSIGETIAVLNTISMTATYPFVLSMLAHIVDSDTTAIQSKIVDATNHPALPNSAYFVVQGVYSTGIRFSELYKLDMESFDVEKINELNFERIFAATDGLMWSPNGRYLLRSHFNLDEARWHLAIYDTLTQETLYNTVTAPKEAELQQYLDWSADDGWLVIANQGYLRLVSLETGYEQLVIDEGFKCETAVWVNRTP